MEQQKDAKLPASLPDGTQKDQPVTLSIYEQLYRQLHAYYFGAISFLELLDAFEEALDLKPHDAHDDVA